MQSSMRIGGIIYHLTLLTVVLVFQSCCPSKEVTSNKKTKNTTVQTTLPASAAMNPNRFRAETEVLSVTAVLSSASGEEYYMASILLHAVTGRGSSLIEIVSAGDTINCMWPGYKPSDEGLKAAIAGKKLMEAVIEETPGPASENYTHFTIQSYQFK